MHDGLPALVRHREQRRQLVVDDAVLAGGQQQADEAVDLAYAARGGLAHAQVSMRAYASTAATQPRTRPAATFGNTEAVANSGSSRNTRANSHGTAGNLPTSARRFLRSQRLTGPSGSRRCLRPSASARFSS